MSPEVNHLNLQPRGTINLKLTGFLNTEWREHYLVQFTVRTVRVYTLGYRLYLRETLSNNMRIDGLRKCLDYFKDQNIRTLNPNLTDTVREVHLMTGADF